MRMLIERMQSKSDLSISYFLCLMIVAMHMAHARALQSCLMALVLLSSLLAYRRSGAGLHDAGFAPLTRSLLAWIVLVVCSVAWSPDVSRTVKSVADAALFPAICFFSAILTVSGSLKYQRIVMCGILAGQALLDLTSLAIAAQLRFDVLKADSGSDPTLLFPWLVRWYPGPGVASTLVALSLPMLFWLDGLRLFPRWLILSIGGASLVCGVLTANRMLWPCVLVLVLVLAASRVRALHRPRLRDVLVFALAGLALCLAVIAAATLYRYGLGFSVTALGKATDLIVSDGRALVWKVWFGAGADNVFWGTGFGKGVASAEYDQALTQGVLAGMTPPGKSHPHNLFLATWVQTGLVGLFIFVNLFVVLIRHGLRLWSYPSTAIRGTGAALIGIVLMLAMKNMTDDFYDKEIPALFWTYCGVLLGHQVCIEKEGHGIRSN